MYTKDSGLRELKNCIKRCLIVKSESDQTVEFILKLSQFFEKSYFFIVRNFMEMYLFLAQFHFKLKNK